MSPALVLFIIRLISALLLLGFFGLIAWFIYQDLRQATAADEAELEAFGMLRTVDLVSGTREYGAVYPLYMVTRIGRSSKNTVTLADDTYASNEHALITRREGQWWLEDLDSRNGTLLNEVVVEAPALVIDGDVITVGQTSLELDLHSSV